MLNQVNMHSELNLYYLYTLHEVFLEQPLSNFKPYKKNLDCCYFNPKSSIHAMLMAFTANIDKCVSVSLVVIYFAVHKQKQIVWIPPKNPPNVYFLASC